MRPTRTFARCGLAGAAALALLTACSGGSSDRASSSTSASTTSSAATTTQAAPTGADAAFCTAVTQLVSQLGQVQAAPPAQVPALLQQLVTEFDAVQPPAAVQTDWGALGTGLHQLQTAVSSIDVNSAAGQAQLRQLEQQATTAAAPAQGTISAWVLSNCGGSSATTSVTAATSS